MFAYLVDRLDDPVDAWIAADGLVLGVDEDDLVVLVCRVLVDPVRVEHAQVAAALADALLGGRLEGSLVLELVHTLVRGLACELRKWSAGAQDISPAATSKARRLSRLKRASGTHRKWHPSALASSFLLSAPARGR